MDQKLTFLLILLSCVLLGCNRNSEIASSENPTREPKSFTTLTVRNDTIFQKINLTGRVIPSQKIDIIPEVEGTMLATGRPFKEGVTYGKGEVLVRIDDAEARYTLIAQKSQFVKALIGIMSIIQLDYPGDFNKWNRFLKGIDVKKAIPDIPETINDQLRYYLSGQDIYNLYYGIKSQEERLKSYTIRAPFSGTLSLTTTDVGNLVRPGSNLGTFVKTDHYEVKASVPAIHINDLELGKRIHLWANNINKSVIARVARFGPGLDAETQSVPVYLTISDADLREGMYLEGELQTVSFPNALKRFPRRSFPETAMFLYSGTPR